MMYGTSAPEIFVASQPLFAISFNKSHRLECLGVAVLVLVNDDDDVNDLSFRTRDHTCAPCCGSAES